MESLLKFPQVTFTHIEARIAAANKSHKSQKTSPSATPSQVDTFVHTRSPFYYTRHDRDNLCRCRGPKCQCCSQRVDKILTNRFSYLHRKQQSQHMNKTITEPTETMNSKVPTRFTKIKKNRHHKRYESTGNFEQQIIHQAQSKLRAKELEDYVNQQFLKLSEKTRRNFEDANNIKCDDEVKQKLVRFFTEKIRIQKKLITRQLENLKVEKFLLSKQFGKTVRAAEKQEGSTDNNTKISLDNLKGRTARDSINGKDSKFRFSAQSQNTDKIRRSKRQQTDERVVIVRQQAKWRYRGSVLSPNFSKILTTQLSKSEIQEFAEKLNNMSYQDFEMILNGLKAHGQPSQKEINNISSVLNLLKQKLKAIQCTDPERDKKLKLIQLYMKLKAIPDPKGAPVINVIEASAEKQSDSSEKRSNKKKSTHKGSKQHSFRLLGDSDNGDDIEEQGIRSKVLPVATKKKLSSLSLSSWRGEEGEQPNIKQRGSSSDKSMVNRVEQLDEMNELRGSIVNKRSDSLGRSSKMPERGKSSKIDNQSTFYEERQFPKKQRLKTKTKTLKSIHNDNKDVIDRGSKILKRHNLTSFIIQQGDAVFSKKKKIRHLREYIKRGNQQLQNMEQIIRYLALYEEQCDLLVRRNKMTAQSEEQIGGDTRFGLITQKYLKQELKFMKLDDKFVFGEADDEDFCFEPGEVKDYLPVHLKIGKKSRIQINTNSISRNMHRSQQPINKSKEDDLIQKSVPSNGPLIFVEKKQEQSQPVTKILKKSPEKSIEKILQQLKKKKLKKESRNALIQNVKKLLLTQFSTLAPTERSASSKEISFN